MRQAWPRACTRARRDRVPPARQHFEGERSMTRINARFLWSWPLVAAAGLMAPRLASAGVTAAVVGNQLQVTGDGADDSITLRLLAGDATQVEVLDGVVVRGTFARAAFASILVQGGAGNDTILVSDVNGVFTDTHVTV